MLNKNQKAKFLAVILIFNLLVQIILPIIPMEVIAAEVSVDTEEITRNYEIKEEETWDISENEDGSVIAKWTRDNRTLTISGIGEMKEWIRKDTTEDWHNTLYTDVIVNVIIEEEITNIKEGIFRDCSNLVSIEIPSTVTIIGEEAFSGCSSLTNITIPESVTKIEKYVFSGCSSLTNINNGQQYQFKHPYERNTYGFVVILIRLYNRVRVQLVRA